MWWWIIRLPLALWLERRARIKEENAQFADVVATFTLGALYWRWGTDEQLEWVYEHMQELED